MALRLIERAGICAPASTGTPSPKLRMLSQAPPVKLVWASMRGLALPKAMWSSALSRGEDATPLQQPLPVDPDAFSVDQIKLRKLLDTNDSFSTGRIDGIVDVDIKWDIRFSQLSQDEWRAWMLHLMELYGE